MAIRCIRRREARRGAPRRVHADASSWPSSSSVETVITFSGCPGGDPQATQPNWIVSPWPPEFSEMLEWQWQRARRRPTGRRRRRPRKRPACASRSRCTRTSSPTTRRRCCGCATIAPSTIGCNFDPSHMFWQQVDVRRGDPRARRLASSTCTRRTAAIDRANTRVNGVLDAKNYTRRARALVDLPDGRLRQRRDLSGRTSSATLRHGRLRPRHQHRARRQPDVRRRGLKKAIAFLKPLVISEPAGEAYWA